ncbi:DUF29 domain-containing protein [Roseicella aerolata]|uniref:DUF29 domain-containing protein n=1 Tax=Roseicella aerolata TaxID=2883479 RepID=A0A9X1IA78_9PROT|nr:DUF29 domain-containing protein [Roseicella aerolata]MCB4820797.1 DUF29 domain-containing protein [Roseicella aerolata]
MPDDLYHRDILAWSIAQAERLRRVAAGERVNDIDWENVIEEIESVGRSEARSVDSLLTQALVHALKVAAWPDHAASRKWRNEIGLFLDQARSRYSPGMAQVLDLAAMHRRARRLVLDLDMRRPPQPLPEAIDLTLAGLLDESLGADALIARLKPR